jgi:hypothetical protein
MLVIREGITSVTILIVVGSVVTIRGSADPVPQSGETSEKPGSL